MTRDPYRYFRIEARELLEGLSRDVLQLEQGGAVADVVARVLRQAHTLKGAARVVKQTEIADLAHAAEELLEPHRGGAPVPREGIDRLLQLIDTMAARLGTLGAPAPAAPQAPAAPAQPAAEEPAEAVRVEMGEMESLLRGIVAVNAQLADLRQAVAPLVRARQLAGALLDETSPRRGLEFSTGGHGLPALARVRSLAEEMTVVLERCERGLDGAVGRAARGLEEVQDAAQRLRLLSAGAIFTALQRAVRDAAQSTQKQAELVASGGEVRLEAHVLAALREALLHLVRNAVAHGIETPAARRAAGKPPVGRVELRAERRSSHVVFICKDDGQGIDLDQVRRSAVGRGLLSPAESRALSPAATVELLLKGGVTTTSAVSQIAGRGIGLSVVHETAQRLGGEVRVTTDAGRGTAVEVQVPVSLLSIPALLVESRGSAAAMPLDAVRQTARVAQDDVVRSPSRAAILCDGDLVPFFILGNALGGPAVPISDQPARPAVIVQMGTDRVAVGVDRLVGVTEVAVRALAPRRGAHGAGGRRLPGSARRSTPGPRSARTPGRLPPGRPSG